MADRPDPDAPTSGSEELDQPAASPQGDATPEGDVEAGMTASAAASVAAGQRTAGSAAALVAAGILSSRLIGFVRERATAYFFGVGPHADVFRVALRAPNLLQNLLGE